MNYYEYFLVTWVPIYKLQLKDNDHDVRVAIRRNVNNNIHLTDKEKNNILRKLKLIKYE